MMMLFRSVAHPGTFLLTDFLYKQIRSIDL